MNDWPEVQPDLTDILPPDDPWLKWATKLLDIKTDDYTQLVAKALRNAYWRGQGECTCECR